MELSQYDPAARARRAWNAGKNVGAKRALKPRQIWEVRFFLDRKGRLRDRALFDLAVDSKLRGCDLVAASTSKASGGRRLSVAGSACRSNARVFGRARVFGTMRETFSSWAASRHGSLGRHFNALVVTLRLVCHR